MTRARRATCPRKSSRTSTQEMARPAMELTTATMAERTSVSSSAATASGLVTSVQNALQPPLNALVTTAASGSRTRSDR